MPYLHHRVQLAKWCSDDCEVVSRRSAFVAGLQHAVIIGAPAACRQ